jgi:hypothetical protein
MIDKLTAILSINSTAQVSLTDDDYDTINWGDTTVISLADIEAKQAELQAIEDNKETLKASAKAKLIAGEALTEDEANTIVI